MHGVELHLHEAPGVTDPILICGLPDSGYVAKIAIDYLLRHLNGKLYADIYTPSLPAQIVIHRDSTAELMKNELYFVKGANGQPDLVVYTGNAQPTSPEGAHALAHRVLDHARELGVRRVFILAAFIRGAPVETPRVFVSGTDADLLRPYDAQGAIAIGEGNITWMHGLLLGVAKQKGLDAVCLSGETPGDSPDPRAAEAILRLLVAQLELRVDLAGLSHRDALTLPEDADGEDEQPQTPSRPPGYIR
jgi:uncharacterized protein (TIGR00162 family)